MFKKMKALLALGLLLLLPLCAWATEIKVPIYQLNDNVETKGIGEEVGFVRITESSYGLMFHVDMISMAQGEHGFHIHENPSCELAMNEQNQPVPGLKAGGHYDPLETGKHLGPYNEEGHLGDLPFLTANTEGRIQSVVLAPRLVLSDVEGRSIMIHAHGDNYSDSPQPLGGGGARMACGVVPDSIEE